MVSPARLAAYHALTAVETHHADLPAALAEARSRLHSERDRALAAEIVTGTLRWQGQLDALISHFARRSPSRLDEAVLIILRLSVYQLLHLDRIPAAAATNEAVLLTRHVRRASAGGFVNAVLRAILRSRGNLPLPPRPAAETVGRLPLDAVARAAALDYLTVTLSHPRWLAARWLDRYGFDAAVRWEEFNNSAAALTLRVNTLKITSAEVAEKLRDNGIMTRPTTYAPDGLVVSEGNPLSSPLVEAGLFLVQDEASQLVGTLASLHAGRRALDCCASPGGKTAAIAAGMRGRGLVVAADIRERRLALLRRTVEDGGLRDVKLVRLDARQPLPFRSQAFDLVLVDAPCSGLGTIRRDPEIRWRRSESDLARFADMQGSMLHQGADAVAPGGCLVYATCSSEPEENDEVVDRFLADHPLFRLVDARSGRLPRGLEAVLDERGMLRSSPANHGLEAFFGAIMRRS